MRQQSKQKENEIKFGVGNVRVYPTDEQKAYFFSLFGANRWFWNQIKDMTDKRYENNPKLSFLSVSALKRLLPRLKREHAWLKEVNSTSLQATAESYCNARKPSSSRSLKAENLPNLSHVIITCKVLRLRAFIAAIKPKMISKKENVIKSMLLIHIL